MKVGKRIIQCIIATIVLVAIVATAPVLSSASVVLAQQSAKTPPNADLKIENSVNAINGCSFNKSTKPPFPEVCPQGEKNGLTTIYGTATEEGKKVFPAGSWGAPTHVIVPIPIERDYEITTTVPTPRYSFEAYVCAGLGCLWKWYHFEHDNTHILGLKDGCEAIGKTAQCDTNMGFFGATIKVVYDWKYAPGK
jgi:hypothetical protein